MLKNLLYGWSNFVADFGGYLGLLLGHSVLSFYDFGKDLVKSKTCCCNKAENM